MQEGEQTTRSRRYKPTSVSEMNSFYKKSLRGVSLQIQAEFETGENLGWFF